MNATASTLPSGPQLDTRRVAAAAIDVALLAPLAAALYALADGVSPAFVALVAGWALFYFFAFESGDGQTPGKRLLGLRVLRGDGRPADMGTIAVRTALRVIDFAIGLLVMSATGQRRARVGDLAAGTVVVDARRSANASLASAAPAEAAAPAAAEPAAQELHAEPAELHEPAQPEPVVELHVPAEDEEHEPLPGAEAEVVELELHHELDPHLSAWAPVSVPEEPEEPAAELDETDPEQWMLAQREQAQSEPAEELEQPEAPAPAPQADLFVHPDEEEERPVF